MFLKIKKYTIVILFIYTLLIWQAFALEDKFVAPIGIEEASRKRQSFQLEATKLKPINSITELKIIKQYYAINNNITIFNSFNKKELQNNTIISIIRKFHKNKQPFYLAVDTKTLDTFVIDAKEIDDNLIIIKDDKIIKNTNLYKILNKYKKSTLFNFTPKNKDSNVIKFALTIDMCSSSSLPHLQWEKRDLFDWLVSLSRDNMSAIPIYVCVTTRWMYNNQSKFNQLLDWKNNGYLDIKWVNHSANHNLNQDEKGELHFLTSKNTDFDKEVLEVEKMLLEQNQVPSLFFRFPGLRYNEVLLNRLNEMSLIALDSDAWINKGEQIYDGAIVLVHGNGNEHSGIVKLKEAILQLTSNKKFSTESLVDINLTPIRD